MYLHVKASIGIKISIFFGKWGMRLWITKLDFQVPWLSKSSNLYVKNLTVRPAASSIDFVCHLCNNTHLFHVRASYINLYFNITKMEICIRLNHKVKHSMRILNQPHSTFFCFGKFLKKLAEDQCSSITKGSVYYVKHMHIQPLAWTDQKFDV